MRISAPSAQNEFIAFRPKLKSFIYRLVTHRQDTEDILQETYTRAFEKFSQFEGRSTFKTWVFAIAHNLCRDFLKEKNRWREDLQDLCRTATLASQRIQSEMGEIAMHSPQGKFLIREHIDYCFTCLAKSNSVEDQICLILKEVYAFTVPEIQTISGLTEGQVKYSLTTTRRKMERIFDERCALVNKQGTCQQCSELNGMFNPAQQAEIEIQQLKLAKAAAAGKPADELLELRLALIREIDPIEAQGFDLHNYMLENLESHTP